MWSGVKLNAETVLSHLLLYILPRDPGQLGWFSDYTSDRIPAKAKSNFASPQLPDRLWGLWGLPNFVCSGVRPERVRVEPICV
jgi:hypothetical protein